MLALAVVRDNIVVSWVVVAFLCDCENMADQVELRRF